MSNPQDEWVPVSSYPADKDAWAPVNKTGQVQAQPAAHTADEDWVPVDNTGKVTFTKTPHKYDTYIQDAARQNKLDADGYKGTDILRAVAMRESNMGTSLDKQNRGDHGHGYGVWQYDDQRGRGMSGPGRPQSELDMAANNPNFAAHKAATMIRDNLNKYGTIRRALAAYNAGDPDSKAGLAYADDVLGRTHTLDPLAIAQGAPKAAPGAHTVAEGWGQLGSAHMKPVQGLPGHQAEAGVSSLEDLQKAGQGLIQDFHHPMHTLNKAFVHGEQTQDWIRRNPVTALGAGLSTLQRPAMSIATDIIEAGNHWPDPYKVLAHAYHAVMTPADQDKMTNALETAIMHDIGMSKFNAADMHGVGKFVADLVTQTAADPLTYIPVVDLFTTGGRAVRMLAAASHAKGGLEASLKAMGPVANTPVVRKLLSKLGEYMDSAHGVVQRTGKGVTKLLARREDLDVHMPNEGKMARMATESGADYEKSTLAQANSAIRHKFAAEIAGLPAHGKMPPAIQRHLLMEAWKYGDDGARSEANDLLKTMGQPPTAEELAHYPKPRGYITYGSDLQKSFFSKIVPKGPTGKVFAKKNPHIAEALDLLKGAGKGLELDLGKGIVSKVSPAHGAITMADALKARMAVGEEVLRRNMIAHESANLYRKYGDRILKYEPPVSDAGLANWFARKIPDRAEQFTGGHGKDLRAISNAFKLGILSNPIPHGLINVGTATLFHSNPVVAGRGLYYALFGVPRKLEERLSGLGGRTSYWRDVNTIPLPTALKLGVNNSQKWMDKFETGYRASYLQHVDRLMGTMEKDNPDFLLHELLKGQRVNSDIGDYANPTRLVSYLKAVGGLFDTFRFDVVPRAGIAALKGRTGQTIALEQRAQHDFSEQFMPKGSELQLFGPLGDFAHLGANAFDFATSPASLGPLLGGGVQGLKDQAGGYVHNLYDDLNWLGSGVVPGAGSVMKLFDKRNNAPPWVKFWAEAVGGGYTKRQPSPRTEKRRRRAFQKAASA